MPTQHPHDVFPSCQPVLEVDDVQQAIAYYRESLGFEYGDPLAYACVGRPFASAGAATFIRFTNWCRDRVTNSGWLAIFVDLGLDELYEEYRERGVEICQEIGDREWGMREFDLSSRLMFC